VGDAGRTRAELIEEIEKLRGRLTPPGGAPASGAAAQRQAEARHRRIIENATDLIAEVDGQGRLLFLTPNSGAILGRPPEQMLGRSVRDVVEHAHPDDRPGLFRAFAAATRGEADADTLFRYRRADGEWRWLESKARGFLTPEREWRAIIIARDVTDREQALRELRTSEERYRVLSETTLDLLAELDAEGRVVFVSPSCQEVLGFRPEEIVGTTPFNLIHPDDVERLAQLFLTRLDADHRPQHNQVFRVRHRSGEWRWLQGGGVNFRAPDGSTHIVSVSRDVTERVRHAEERRMLEERVRRAQKLESLALMAGGVAHDFNNLLTPILGDASLALMDLPTDSPVRARLQRIQRAAHHAASLTRQLLDYAGIGSLDVEPLDLSKLVQEMGELLRSAVSKRASLELALAPDLPAVEGDASQLSQVVMNLITNASEAIEAAGDGPGRIEVRSGRVELSRDQLARLFLGEDLAPGRFVFVEVEDSGSGMDEETRARVFDPFFTTKFTGRGLGLAAAHGIVRKHGGAVEIESALGRGTRVRVLFPSSGRGPRQAPPAATERSRWRTSGTVLVADDDEGARELVAETLERAGLSVLRAGDGAGAAAAFRANAAAVRLVVLDLTMPGAAGAEAFDEIRAVRAEVPILLVSGYSAESTEQRLAGRRVDGFLQKPFLPESLLDRVRALLQD
jgi:PAS domain S-box-containing protein